MNKQCETPCLCNTCLKARDEELNRLRGALVEKIEGMKLPVKERYFQPWKDYMIVGNECYNQALSDLLEHLKK